MQPHYSIISSEYIMDQKPAFLRIYPTIAKLTNEFGSKATCRVLYYPEPEEEDEEQLLPPANNGNYVVVGMYNIIIINEGFIYGDNNIIIGDHNTIKGEDNIVLGSSNYFVHHDLEYLHTRTRAETIGSLKNVVYTVSTLVLEQFKIQLKALATALKVCNSATNYNFSAAKIHLKAFYHTLQKTIMAAVPPLLSNPNIPTTRRQTRQQPSYRSEPYHLRSGNTNLPQPVTVQQLPGTIHICGIILEWLNDLITNVHYEEIVDYVDDYYTCIGEFLDTIKTEHDEEVAEQQQSLSGITIPRGQGQNGGLPGGSIGGAIMNFMMGQEFLNLYMDEAPNEEEEEEGPPTEQMLPPRNDSEPAVVDGETDKCIICETRAVSTEMVPCGHHYSCVTCVHHPSMSRKCALCRTPFERITLYKYQPNDSVFLSKKKK